MTELIADLKGRRAMEVTSRAEKVRNAQKKLAARSDRILQALVDKASPGLSEHETKWFDELKRMKEDINGAGRYDEGSLSARAKLVWETVLSLMISSSVYSSSGSMTGCCQA